MPLCALVMRSLKACKDSIDVARIALLKDIFQPAFTENDVDPALVDDISEALQDCRARHQPSFDLQLGEIRCTDAHKADQQAPYHQGEFAGDVHMAKQFHGTILL